MYSLPSGSVGYVDEEYWISEFGESLEDLESAFFDVTDAATDYESSLMENMFGRTESSEGAFQEAALQLARNNQDPDDSDRSVDNLPSSTLLTGIGGWVADSWLRSSEPDFLTQYQPDVASNTWQERCIQCSVDDTASANVHNSELLGAQLSENSQDEALLFHDADTRHPPGHEAHSHLASDDGLHTSSDISSKSHTGSLLKHNSKD